MLGSAAPSLSGSANLWNARYESGHVCRQLAVHRSWKASQAAGCIRLGNYILAWCRLSKARGDSRAFSLGASSVAIQLHISKRVQVSSLGSETPANCTSAAGCATSAAGRDIRNRIEGAVEHLALARQLSPCRGNVPSP